jgi:undecaprenyl-diphosphatase
VLAALVATRWGTLTGFDRRLDDRLNSGFAGHRDTVRLWQDVSDVLAPAVLRAALLVAAAVLLVVRRWSAAVLLAAVAVGTSVLSSGVKAWVGRARPTVPHPVAHASGASFPSGHALTAAATALLAVVLLRPLGQAVWRPVAAAFAVVAALAVSFSRLVLGVHYLSDVLGGWLAAVALVAGLRALLPPTLREPVMPPGRPVRPDRADRPDPPGGSP